MRLERLSPTHSLVNVVIDVAPAEPCIKTHKKSRPKKRLFGAMAALLILGTSGLVFWPRTPQDLSVNNRMVEARLYEHWRAGDLIVLVRHAERCDRSRNPCLGAIDGITAAGSTSAVALGNALRTLGLENTDVMSSPLTRTRQTAQYMFNQAVITQDWLDNCELHLIRDAQAHKVAHRNLLLVTHSACISEVERQFGFPHALSSEYTSSLFINTSPSIPLNILGIMNERNWPQTLRDTYQ